MSALKTTVTLLGETSIPAIISSQWNLKPGQTLCWQKVGDNECRVFLDGSAEPTAAAATPPDGALRQWAEALDREKASPSPEDLSALPSGELQHTLHELRVHRIELEMQNEELRLAQAELDAAHNRYFDLYHLAPVGYCTIDDEGLIQEANLSTATLLGVPRRRLLQQRLSRFIHGDDQDRYYLHAKQIRATGGPRSCELRLVKPDGALFWARLQSSTDAVGAPICRITLSDITERKQAEAALRGLNRQLRAITNCNQASLRATEERALLQEVCHILCAEAGYHMVWVGYAEADAAKTVRPVAWSGVEDGYLNTANITWADADRGRGPTGTAIRCGTITHVQDITTDPRMSPWRERALERGYGSSIALPLKGESGVPFGACTLYARQPNAFTPDEIRLLEGLAEDLAFGINALRTRIERKRVEDALRASLAEKGTLLREVHHRVKNNLQIVRSLLNLQAGQIQDATVLDLLAVIRNRVGAMALLHENLYQSENLARLHLPEYVERLCAQLLRAIGPGHTRVRLERQVEPETVSLTLDQAVPCGLLLNELVTNALKYAFPGDRSGCIRVTLERATPQSARLTVADDGVGLPATLDPRRTSSLGLRLVSLLTGQLHGTVHFERGQGTVVQILFPNSLPTETPHE